MTLPAKWDNIKYTVTESLDGTHTADIHPEQDEALDVMSHTHCSECDKPFNVTSHFYGGGIIHDECIDIKYPGVRGCKEHGKK